MGGINAWFYTGANPVMMEGGRLKYHKGITVVHLEISINN